MPARLGDGAWMSWESSSVAVAAAVVVAVARLGGGVGPTPFPLTLSGGLLHPTRGVCTHLQDLHPTVRLASDYHTRLPLPRKAGSISPRLGL